MKIFIGIILVAILSYIGQLFFPWWIILPIGMALGAILNTGSWSSFLYGFLGIALLWGLYAGWINSSNEGILANRMGDLFGGLSGISVLLVTVLLGGLVGGMGALTGNLIGNYFDNKAESV